MTQSFAKQKYLFANRLEDNLKTYRSENFLDIIFMTDLDEFTFVAEQSDDISFNAAWYLADEFFDAVWHGFPILGHSLSIQEGEKLLVQVIDCLKQDREITHPDILKFYQAPSGSQGVKTISKKFVDFVKSSFG